jgi:hypothetical protein
VIDQKYFLPLPLKRTEPCPELPLKLKEYISEHFSDAHPDAFDADASKLLALRREWLQGEHGPDLHVNTLDGLILSVS